MLIRPGLKDKVDPLDKVHKEDIKRLTQSRNLNLVLPHPCQLFKAPGLVCLIPLAGNTLEIKKEKRKQAFSRLCILVHDSSSVCVKGFHSKQSALNKLKGLQGCNDMSYKIISALTSVCDVTAHFPRLAAAFISVHVDFK